MDIAKITKDRLLGFVAYAEKNADLFLHHIEIRRLLRGTGVALNGVWLGLHPILGAFVEIRDSRVSVTPQMLGRRVAYTPGQITIALCKLLTGKVIQIPFSQRGLIIGLTDKTAEAARSIRAVFDPQPKKKSRNTADAEPVEVSYVPRRLL